MFYTTHISNTANDWVIFIHGIGGNISTYKRQIDDFKCDFNLLIFDLYSHGNSFKSLNDLNEISFKEIAKQITLTMDELKISKAHFIGISLGSMIIRAVAEIHPERVGSIITGGTIVKYNLLCKLIFSSTGIIKNFIHPHILYFLFALILMPNKNHRIARNYFYREAKKIKPECMFAWIDLMKTFDNIYPPAKLHTIRIPKLYLMGNEDHMFYNSCKLYAQNDRYAKFITLNCGHVPHIEKTHDFNTLSIEFLKNNKINYMNENNLIKIS